MQIKKIEANIIKNSRNEDAIEVVINDKFKASAPSGASKGKYEVLPFPLNDVNKGREAIKNAKDLIGLEIKEFEDLNVVETILDPDLVGGDTTIAVEFAILKALSNNSIWQFLNSSASSLPIPLGNCIGGGKHFRGNGPDIQEFLLVPRGERFYNNALANNSIYSAVGKRLNINEKTDEGAFAPSITNIEVLDLLSNVIKENKTKFGFDISIGIDVASTSLVKDFNYVYKNYSTSYREKSFNQEEQISFISSLIRKYKLAYIEDPLYEEDFNGFSKLRKKYGLAETLICGDDLICTRVERLKNAIKKQSVNAVIIKPNQIGSLIKTKEAVDIAFQNKIIPVISHRSGETMDATVSHLAVAWNLPYIKCGIFGKERMAKINELINIEKEMR